MAFDLTNLIPIYVDNISNLIRQMGKTVTIYYKQTISSIDDTVFDKIHDDFEKKPSYKTNNGENVTNNIETILALIKYAPKDYINFNINVSQPDSIIRLKTFIEDVPKLQRAEFIIPSDTQDIIYTKYRLLREVVPVGLKENRFAVSFWGRI